MSSQMLRNEIKRLGHQPSSDNVAGLRTQLSLLYKESNHAEETQRQETGSEETPQGREEEKTQEPQESPSGEEGSKDS